MELGAALRPCEEIEAYTAGLCAEPVDVALRQIAIYYDSRNLLPAERLGSFGR